jgi:hypothetical protein
MITDDKPADGSESPHRHDVLMTQLAQAPVVEVSGIIDAGGPVGSSSGKPGGWHLRVSFVAWKYVGGDIQSRELALWKPVNESELNSWMKKLKANDVVRVRARVLEQNVFGTPQGWLVELSGTWMGKLFGGQPDPELVRRAEELKVPVTFRDKKLGDFTLDRRVNWFESQTQWGSTQIRLSLNVNTDLKANASLAVAHSLWESQKAWDERVRAYAVKELLSLKNENWLGDDEQELSAKEFDSKMTLESITVYPDGLLEFWYSDGDLFWGHSIRVGASLAEGPTDAGIEG